ncbi:MAG: YlxR family protein [Chloroflexi bacterium]|nr:YlxR family protein [Chloroflexota bacterium]
MRRNTSPGSVKHIPQRTCLACRKVKAKQELVRLVCISDGSIEVDIGGKKMGRGAYLCPSAECWEVGLKGSRLAYTLRTTLTRENREQLIKYGDNFLHGVG